MYHRARNLEFSQTRHSRTLFKLLPFLKKKKKKVEEVWKDLGRFERDLRDPSRSFERKDETRWEATSCGQASRRSTNGSRVEESRVGGTREAIRIRARALDTERSRSGGSRLANGSHYTAHYESLGERGKTFHFGG